MRITTQMLNESAQSAGVEIKHSLLDYINSDDSSGLLQQVLSSTGTSGTQSTSESTYKKLSSYAEELTTDIDKLTGDEDSLIDALADSDDRTELISVIEDMVDSYNSTRTSLVKAQGTLNTYYAKLMKENSEEYADELYSVGITVSGTKLTVNTDKLESASYEELKEILGSDSGFMKKLSTIAEHVSDNAEASLESLSSQYNSSGVSYSLLSGSYDSKG